LHLKGLMEAGITCVGLGCPRPLHLIINPDPCSQAGIILGRVWGGPKAYW